MGTLVGFEPTSVRRSHSKLEVQCVSHYATEPMEKKNQVASFHWFYLVEKRSGCIQTDFLLEIDFFFIF